MNIVDKLQAGKLQFQEKEDGTVYLQIWSTHEPSWFDLSTWWVNGFKNKELLHEFKLIEYE